MQVSLPPALRIHGGARTRQGKCDRGRDPYGMVQHALQASGHCKGLQTRPAGGTLIESLMGLGERAAAVCFCHCVML